jgi:hypothetical protein
MLKYEWRCCPVENSIDEQIADVRRKIEEVKKRWPFHSPKPALFRELENLELELKELIRRKKDSSFAES